MTDAMARVLAAKVSANGQCSRRQIGCVLLDDAGAVLAMGANGPPASLGACRGTDLCPARDLAPGAGSAASACYGAHAEITALIAAGDLSSLHTAVCTKAPCTACTLALLTTTCRRILYRTASNETTNRDLWTRAGREWTAWAS